MSSSAFVDITDFGAKAGQLCTEAINRAIDSASQTGGTVFVPPGHWESGTIFMKSGVTLHVDPAAVLKGSPRIEDYPKHEANTHEHDDHSFIYAENVENISITGGGILDGGGEAFWDPPVEGGKWYRARLPRVSPMLEFRYCKRVTLRNIRIFNSPGWTVHPYCCEDVTLDGVRVVNHLFGPNTDGFDIDGCRDVFISNCHLICGDDGIIIKATPKAQSTERVVISNCIIQSNCIAIGIGQETQCGVRQVAISNCVCYKSHRMFTIGIWDGGIVEDITVNGLTGDTLAYFYLARPIQIESKQLHSIPKTRPLGIIRNVNISNIVCKTQGRILITAEKGATIEHISMRDIRLEYVYREDAETLSPPNGNHGSSQYANCNEEARQQHAALILENVSHFDCSDLTIQWSGQDAKNTAPGLPEKEGLRHNPPYHAVWARNVTDSRIVAPYASASNSDTPDYVIENCATSDFSMGRKK